MKKNKKKKLPQKPNKPDLSFNIKLFFTGLIAYFLLFWLFPVYTFVALYLIIGLIIASVNGKNNANLYIGGLIGFFGSVFASVFMTVDKYIYYVNTMPMNANPDIPGSLYTETLFNLVKLSPLSYMSPLLYILISTVLCAAFTQLGLIKEIKKLAGHICVAVLVLNFLFISLYSTRDLARYASVEPQNLSYAYDAIGFIKTVYLMDNKDYYKAHLEAQFNDIRRNKDGTVTEEGFKMSSVLNIRQPFIFYVWKYVSVGSNVSRVLYLSIIFCVGLLILSYVSAVKLIGEDSYALIMPILITPFLFTGTTWANIFFPDWWTGLFLFAAFLFWVLKKYWASAFLLLFALLCREVIAISYILFIVLALFKDRSALKPLLLVGGMFLAAFGFHYINASELFVGGKAGSPLASFGDTINFHLAPTMSYMMFLYGYFKIPLIIIFLLSLSSSIINKRLEFILFAFYALIHDSLAFSSYWGMHFMLIVIFTLLFFLKSTPTKLSVR